MAVSLQQFVDSLIESGLMTAEEVKRFVAGLPEPRRPEYSQDFARELVTATRSDYGTSTVRSGPYCQDMIAESTRKHSAPTVASSRVIPNRSRTSSST